MTARKQKHVTTVYHVIWAELLDTTIALSFIERKKKTRTVCIKATVQGSTTKAEEWVEELLKVAYKGVGFWFLDTSSLMTWDYTRYQTEQETEGPRQPFFREGEASLCPSGRLVRRSC